MIGKAYDLKLGSLKQGGRDGTLVVVSDDLSRAIPVPQIAFTLQGALDDWERCADGLRRVSETLPRRSGNWSRDRSGQDAFAVAARLPMV